MKRRSFVMALVCLAGIMLLAGCGNETASFDSDKKEEVQETSEKTEEPSDDKDEKKPEKKSGKKKKILRYQMKIHLIPVRKSIRRSFISTKRPRISSILLKKLKVWDCRPSLYSMDGLRERQPEM